MLLLFVCIPIFLICILYLEELYRTRRQRDIVKGIPGPHRYPLIGSTFEFGFNTDEYLPRLVNMVQQYGPIFKVWIGPTLFIVMSDRKDIQAILSSTTCLHKSLVYDFFHDWMGTGLLSSPPEKWKIQRKILTPVFHMTILHSYMKIFSKNIEIMINQLEKEVGKDSFDITHYIDKCTLDIICESAMATSVNAQVNEESEFPKALKIVSMGVLERIFKPWLHPNKVFKLSSMGRNYFKHLRYVKNFVDDVIRKKKIEHSLKKEEAKQQIVNEDKGANINSNKKFHSFLDLVLQQYAEDPSVQISDKNIRDQVNTFMFAGHDTTSSALGFAVYFLGKHPEVQEKLFSEVNKVLGDNARDITYQDLADLKYTELVIKETLRLRTPVPYIGRKAHEDIHLPSGYTIPAGAHLTLMLFCLQRNPELFPDPETFNPDRFLPKESPNRQPFAYVPFSAGPRNCIGQKFAMLEIKATLAKLVQTFKITSTMPEPIILSDLVMRSSSGINVRLEKRRKY